MKIATKKLAYHLRAESVPHSTKIGQTYCSQLLHKLVIKQSTKKKTLEKFETKKKLNKKDNRKRRYSIFDCAQSLWWCNIASFVHQNFVISANYFDFLNMTLTSVANWQKVVNSIILKTKRFPYHLRAESVPHSTKIGQTYCSKLLHKLVIKHSKKKHLKRL